MVVMRCLRKVTKYRDSAEACLPPAERAQNQRGNCDTHFAPSESAALHPHRFDIDAGKRSTAEWLPNQETRR